MRRMYYHPNIYPYPYPYPVNIPIYNYETNYPYWTISYENEYQPVSNAISFRDHGKEPFVVNINKATKQNRTFRTALWTGEHLQVTLMSIRVGEDIGLEVHPNVDQF
jgi:hypothetical protein